MQLIIAIMTYISSAAHVRFPPNFLKLARKKKKKKRYNALQSKGCNEKHAVGTHTMRKIKHSQVKQSIK